MKKQSKPKLDTKRINRLISEYERGFRFTNRQIESITKQLKQGKVPKLTIGGLRLDIDQYSTVRQITDRYLQSNRIGQKVNERLLNKPANGPKEFLINDRIKNKHGVELIPEQFTRLKQRTNQVNNYIRQQWYRDNALMVKGMAQSSNGKYKPIEAIAPRWQFTTLDFANMRKETFVKYVERLDAIYAGAGISDRTTRQNDAEKENYFKAVQKTFGGVKGIMDVLALIRQINPEVLHDLIASQKLRHVGEVYYGTVESVQRELTAIYYTLEEAVIRQGKNRSVV